MQSSFVDFKSEALIRDLRHLKNGTTLIEYKQEFESRERHVVELSVAVAIRQSEVILEFLARIVVQMRELRVLALDFRNMGISERGSAQVARMLGELRQLREVRISGYPNPQLSANFFAQAIGANVTLRRLSLRFTSCWTLQAAGLRDLFAVSQASLMQLEAFELVLGDSKKVEERVFAQVAQFLVHFQDLRALTLDLQRVQLSGAQDALQRFLGGLRMLNRLQRLQLTICFAQRLREPVVRDLGASLPCLRSLRHLHLDLGTEHEKPDEALERLYSEPDLVRQLALVLEPLAHQRRLESLHLRFVRVVLTLERDTALVRGSALFCAAARRATAPAARGARG